MRDYQTRGQIRQILFMEEQKIEVKRGFSKSDTKLRGS